MEQRTRRASAPPGTPSERRASARRFCAQEIPLHPVSSSPDEIRWASVQNISSTGIGLLLSSHFKRGTYLEMELPLGQGSRLRTVGRVVHGIKGPHGNSYLGC